MYIESATIGDMENIKSLYSEVAKHEGGIARFQEEITDEYIGDFIKNSMNSGIILVARNDSGEVIGEIHAYKSGLRVFEHVLSNLTIAISPDYQGKGIGKKLFLQLLETVENSPDILRVELIARESNKKAISFYQQLGFQIEGALRNKIKDSKGNLENDILMGWLKK